MGTAKWLFAAEVASLAKGMQNKCKVVQQIMNGKLDIEDYPKLCEELKRRFDISEDVKLGDLQKQYIQQKIRY
ncbi:MAG: hypothetical protein NTZ78_04895 [Candidatus Aureabacteria bacterium]|nr:hypothetical protein [Candidatus Auribacterota bacterium]